MKIKLSWNNHYSDPIGLCVIKFWNVSIAIRKSTDTAIKVVDAIFDAHFICIHFDLGCFDILATEVYIYY